MSAPRSLLFWNETPNPCHPERSLAESEAIRQTQSKDPYQFGRTLGNARSLRVVIRFFDKHETQHLPISSREAAGGESPAQKCRMHSTRRDESCKDVTLAPL